MRLRRLVSATVITTITSALLVVAGGAATDAYADAPASPPRTELGTLGGSFSTPAALSETGIAVGDSTTATGQAHAFTWSAGKMTDLGTLGGPESHALAVNDNGQVVGR